MNHITQPSHDERANSTQNGIADARALLNQNEDLRDLLSHRQAWRRALVECLENAKSSVDVDVDVDDAAYWARELRIFDRCFDTLATVIPVTDHFNDPNVIAIANAIADACSASYPKPGVLTS